jgi:YD repeat-containing protein
VGLTDAGDWYVYKRAQQASGDLVTGIRQGILHDTLASNGPLASTIRIEYSTTTDRATYEHYAPTFVSSVRDVSFAATKHQVVKSVVRKDRAPSGSYHYKRQVTDKRTGNLIGFHEVRFDEEGRERWTIVTRSQLDRRFDGTFPFAGAIGSVETHTGLGNGREQVKVTENDFDVVTRASSQVTLGAAATARLLHSSEKVWETTGSWSPALPALSFKEARRSYDAFGNVIHQKYTAKTFAPYFGAPVPSSVADRYSLEGIGSSIEVTKAYPDDSARYFDLPSSVSTTTKTSLGNAPEWGTPGLPAGFDVPTGATRVSTHAYTYDASNRVRTHASDGVTTTFVYDTFGNVTQVTMVTMDGQGRSYDLAYDDEHIFQVALTNTLGQTTRTSYDRRFGSVAFSMGPDHVPTFTVYDGFGRARRLRTPAGDSTWSYAPESFPFAVTQPTAVVRSRDVSGVETKAWVDSYGRV